MRELQLLGELVASTIYIIMVLALYAVVIIPIYWIYAYLNIWIVPTIIGGIWTAIYLYALVMAEADSTRDI